MSDRYAIIVTTINPPTGAVVALRDGATQLPATFYVIGDSKSPGDFSLPGAQWYDVPTQRLTGFRFAEECPIRHYARKNIGYLLAMRDGADVIIETDDDNFPRTAFWMPRQRMQQGPIVRDTGWCNAYRHFSDAHIWPRGLPLAEVQRPLPKTTDSGIAVDCPIQQGLADENPDVDAIYRLILPLPQNFSQGSLILASNAWCPFNSQNTTFWRDTFPLLYLPFYCSFRMTDIWRSFVAQRLAWECGWNILFHGPTVWQERNEHNLLRDFEDEVPGYLHNENIRRALADLSLQTGRGALLSNLETAYDALIKLGVVGADERTLIRAWRSDVEAIG